MLAGVQAAGDVAQARLCDTEVSKQCGKREYLCVVSPGGVPGTPVLECLRCVLKQVLLDVHELQAVETFGVEQPDADHLYTTKHECYRKENTKSYQEVLRSSSWSWAAQACDRCARKSGSAPNTAEARDHAAWEGLGSTATSEAGLLRRLSTAARAKLPFHEDHLFRFLILASCECGSRWVASLAFIVCTCWRRQYGRAGEVASSQNLSKEAVMPDSKEWNGSVG
jgi:hypothetical protein